ncbi:MAG TPA: phosphoglycerate dehydrogenase [Acidimicrobiia bacterium]
MRILVADKLPDSHVSDLRRRHQVTVWDRGTDMVEAVAGHEVLVVRSTKVKAETIDAAADLALVIRAGAGVNTIDWRAAANRGIYVCNTPGKNAVAVAELTMGLITAIDRRIPDAVADLRSGRWRKKEYGNAHGLAGRTLGIIGFGDIGTEVAIRAAAFEMRLVVEERPDRSPRQLDLIEQLDIAVVDRPDLLAIADIVTLHVPATTETVGMVSADFLSRLRPGTVLVNTSRGDIVDEDALLAAIDEKSLWVGLDVFADEPAGGTAEFDSELARHPNVYATHHIGASTEQSQEAIADEVVEIIYDFARGVVRNCVNLASDPHGTVVISVRHHNRVGVLARVLGILRGAGLNVQQMDNRILAGQLAATATIHVYGELTDETVAEVRSSKDVIGVSVSSP